MKKVFSTEKFKEWCETMKLEKTSFYKSCELWANKCNGLTIEEMNKLGYTSGDAWLIEVEETTMNKQPLETTMNKQPLETTMNKQPLETTMNKTQARKLFYEGRNIYLIHYFLFNANIDNCEDFDKLSSYYLS